MNSALLLIDVMKDFYHEKGQFYYEESRQTLPSILRALQIFRKYRQTVIHVFERHTSVRDSEFEKLPVHAIYKNINDVRLPEIEIEKDEIVLLKRRYSAFFSTDLDLTLREKGVKSLFLVGCKTNVCVRATAQDAFELGYRVYVVSDAVSSNRKHLHEASLEDIQRYMGTVLQVNQVEELLKNA